jgi:two-component system response regulator (stage 0 sporulation protein F)
LKQKRILIVDDEVRVAFFLMEGLKGLGDEYEVLTTKSAELALEQVGRQPFDLAVIDHRLPGISGLDLIKRLQDLSPSTQTILITAYSSPELEDEAYRLRAYRYFAKPFHIEDLMCTVQNALSHLSLSNAQT